jgi:hypothetical protein
MCPNLKAAPPDRSTVMIVNAYAVLDAFLSVLRLGLSLFTFGLALAAWWNWRQARSSPEARQTLEDRGYLLYLLSGLLLGLNVAAWPIFYLLLQSYVPEWPGIMCIYGVTQIGAGSVGTSRFLPGLLETLQVLKPAVVFASGAWFVLYLLNRQTRAAQLTGRVLVFLLAAACLGIADAATELAYLVIPKKEVFASGGCCMEAFDARSRGTRFLPQALFGDDAAPWLYAAYLTVNLGMALALIWCKRRYRVKDSPWLLVAVLVGTMVAVTVNAVFLVEVAAPRLLRLPHHHCPYDLVPQAPASLVAIALFVGGTLAVGWACVVGWLGRDSESDAFVAPMVVRLLHMGLIGYLGSLMMMTMELALA